MEIKKAATLKRFGAALLDFSLLIISGSIISSFVCTPIAKNTTDIVDKTAEFNSELFELGYYVIGKKSSDNNKYDIYVDYRNSEEEKKFAKDLLISDSNNYSYLTLSLESLNITNEDYDIYLTHFYTEIDALDSYINQKKNETSLFEEKDGIVVLKDNVETSSVKSFYDTVYSKALSEQKLKEYKNGILLTISNHVNLITQICTYIALGIALIVLYFIIPMVTKYGQTLGKKLMGLGVVNIKDGTPVNKVTTAIRFFAFGIIEFFLSFILYYLPLIISFVITMFNKKGQAIHDFLARTTVVDLIMLQYENIYEENQTQQNTNIQEDAIVVESNEVNNNQSETTEPITENKVEHN